MATEPTYALIEVAQGFVVEKFDRERHISRYGWSLPGVSLFSEREEVAHLRDQILN